MTFAFVVLGFGAILLMSAYRNQGVSDTLGGVAAPDQPTGFANDASGQALAAAFFSGGSGSGTGDSAGSQLATPDAAGMSSGSMLADGGTLGANPTLIQVGKYEQSLGMHVGENPHFGGVSPVHVPGSYHYMGRAIDVSNADAAKMNAAAHATLDALGPAWFTEFIWNHGADSIAIKNGKVVSGPVVYAAVWLGHRNHFHIAK